MNWEAVGIIAEVVAALGIIITLIYLAVQIRQSTEHSKLSSAQAVDTSNMLAFDPIYVPENSVIWTKGHSDPKSLNDHEIQMFKMFMTRLFVASFNTTSLHYSRGMIDEELYRVQADYFRSLVSTPGGSQWYSENRQLLHYETQAQLDKTENQPGTSSA